MILYLANRLFYRFVEFLRHWYVNAFFIISRHVINFLERLDRTFAFKITLRHFFQPLYQDYTLLGYILGFFFRFWRIVIAATLYGLIILIGFFVYILWAAIPLYIVYRGFRS